MRYKKGTRDRSSPLGSAINKKTNFDRGRTRGAPPHGPLAAGRGPGGTRHPRAHTRSKRELHRAAAHDSEKNPRLQTLQRLLECKVMVCEHRHCDGTYSTASEGELAHRLQYSTVAKGAGSTRSGITSQATQARPITGQCFVSSVWCSFEVQKCGRPLLAVWRKHTRGRVEPPRPPPTPHPTSPHPSTRTEPPGVGVWGEMGGGGRQQVIQGEVGRQMGCRRPG